MRQDNIAKQDFMNRRLLLTVFFLVVGGGFSLTAQDTVTKPSKSNMTVKEWRIDTATNSKRLDHVTTYNEIGKKIEEIEGIKLELGSLDITFYRDDLTRLSKHPVVAGNDIAFSIEDKKIILVDDVLYSGRTIRAAMEELFDMGRPEKIELAVLVDRGNRELPIRADYIGKDVPTSHDEYIDVVINDDKLEKVSICGKGDN